MIDLTLSEPQAYALVETLQRGTPPTDGRTRNALQRGQERIEAALDKRRTIPDHAHDCDALSDALSGVGRAEFVTLITARLRDLTDVVRLWTAIERHGRPEARVRLLNPAGVDEADWRSEVVDELDAVGVEL